MRMAVIFPRIFPYNTANSRVETTGESIVISLSPCMASPALKNIFSGESKKFFLMKCFLLVSPVRSFCSLVIKTSEEGFETRVQKGRSCHNLINKSESAEVEH